MYIANIILNKYEDWGHMNTRLADYQRANCTILAEKLLDFRSEYAFNMAHFLLRHGSKDHGQYIPSPFNRYSCNTSACALGHAAYWNIGSVKPGMEWSDYSNQFCSDREWDWLFSGAWSAHDNTPEGAGLRIIYMLQNGTPAPYRGSLRETVYPLWRKFYGIPGLHPLVTEEA